MRKVKDCDDSMVVSKKQLEIAGEDDWMVAMVTAVVFAPMIALFARQFWMRLGNHRGAANPHNGRATLRMKLFLALSVGTVTFNALSRTLEPVRQYYAGPNSMLCVLVWDVAYALYGFSFVFMQRAMVSRLQSTAQHIALPQLLRFQFRAIDAGIILCAICQCAFFAIKFSKGCLVHSRFHSAFFIADREKRRQFRYEWCDVEGQAARLLETMWLVGISYLCLSTWTVSLYIWRLKRIFIDANIPNSALNCADLTVQQRLHICTALDFIRKSTVLSVCSGCTTLIVFVWQYFYGLSNATVLDLALNMGCMYCLYSFGDGLYSKTFMKCHFCCDPCLNAVVSEGFRIEEEIMYASYYEGQNLLDQSNRYARRRRRRHRHRHSNHPRNRPADSSLLSGVVMSAAGSSSGSNVTPKTSSDPDSSVAAVTLNHHHHPMPPPKEIQLTHRLGQCSCGCGGSRLTSAGLLGGMDPMPDEGGTPLTLLSSPPVSHALLSAVSEDDDHDHQQQKQHPLHSSGALSGPPLVTPQISSSDESSREGLSRGESANPDSVTRRNNGQCRCCCCDASTPMEGRIPCQCGCAGCKMAPVVSEGGSEECSSSSSCSSSQCISEHCKSADITKV